MVYGVALIKHMSIKWLSFLKEVKSLKHPGVIKKAVTLKRPG